MKISQEEIDAAIVAYNGSILTVVGRKQINGMTAALTAALTVRRARKQAKRERQRKEKDNTIQKLAADMMTWCGKTLPEMTTDELVSARDELAGFESMSLRENGFYHRMNAEITARKEKDKQVVESVKAPCKAGEIIKIDFSDEDLRAAIINGLIEPTPSKAPEWDGAFGVGEWETRGGIMATVIKINANNKYPLSGNHGTSGLNCWWNDQGVSFLTKCRGFDLIRPWPKSEQ